MRVRPLLKSENAKGGRKVGDIMRVLNNKVVVVLDPDESKVRWERRHFLFGVHGQSLIFLHDGSHAPRIRLRTCQGVDSRCHLMKTPMAPLVHDGEGSSPALC